MNTTARIYSILKTPALSTSITGIQTFELSALSLSKELTVHLPTNLRLGHLAERIVSELIKASDNYSVQHENIQIIDGNDTVGELDFIIEHKKTQAVTHLELAYKFYLFDPSISEDAINNWIGPNRNDSLSEKLNKLKTKQFPLLFDERTAAQLTALDMSTIAQALCLLVSLYVPYESALELPPNYSSRVKGYYLNFETFAKLNTATKSYCLPTKKEWGIDPAENKEWHSFKEIQGHLQTSLRENRSLLCWQKDGQFYKEFFVTWW